MSEEHGKGQFVRWVDVQEAMRAITDDFGVQVELTMYLRKGAMGAVIPFWQLWCIGKGENRVADALYRGVQAPSTVAPSVPAALLGLALGLHDDIEKALRGARKSVTPIEKAIEQAPQE